MPPTSVLAKRVQETARKYAIDIHLFFSNNLFKPPLVRPRGEIRLAWEPGGRPSKANFLVPNLEHDVGSEGFFARSVGPLVLPILALHSVYPRTLAARTVSDAVGETLSTFSDRQALGV